MVSFNFNPGGGTDRGGSWWANYVGVDFRPKSNMEFSLGANFSGGEKQTRWVTNNSYETANGLEVDSSVFADLYKEQISIHASASLMIQRNLSVQISAQGLISGLDYRNYRPYVGNNQYGGAYADAQLDPDNPDAFDRDFTWGSLNSTFLLRYEYRPGSTLYLVWTRAKSDFDSSTNDVGFSRDFNRFFSAGATNVFLVKASYWLNI
jgi:hypothetical protein